MKKFQKTKSISIKSINELTPKNSIEVLKKAWEDLPSDFTFGERSLFLEVAERLIKMTSANDNSN